MPHQCVRCSRIIPPGNRELLEGCSVCTGRFFFYVRDEQLEKIKNQPIEIPQEERKKIEKDIRDIVGITEEDSPVILDLESIRVTGEGKFELDIVKLFQKNQPLVYKLEEGRYIIDLGSTMNRNKEEPEEAKK